MARRRETQKRPVAVQELVDSALVLLAYGMRSSGVAIALDIAPDLPPVMCDADQVQQVLSNLVINARQALETRPPPRHVRLMARADADWMRIDVADNGPGISESIRSRIFDPFFTTKLVGAGTGVGLGVSRGIAEAHGGTFTLAILAAVRLGIHLSACSVLPGHLYCFGAARLAMTAASTIRVIVVML